MKVKVHKSSLSCFSPPLTHAASPQYLWSLTISCAAGVWPSPPWLCGKSNKEDATALAAAHENIEPQRMRQACSARNLISGRSLRARALASWLKNALVSPDDLPPTSTAMTTNWPRLRGPRSSGYVASFLRLGAFNATPSRSAACRLGAPSLCKAHTIVVSMANWNPPWNGNPSTKTSNLRPSCTLGSWMSMSRIMRFVRTRPRASLHILANTLSKANPLRLSTPAREHAARWWPQTSSRRPHRHQRAPRGSAWRRRVTWNK